jgi:CxxC-x17-CxxC domain-containing protein
LLAGSTFLPGARTSTSFADRSLSCRECGTAFVWTAGEQEFYQQKGLLHEPQRCPDCRQRAKAERAALRAQNMHDIVCSSCGQAGQVPFAPRTDRPVYCSTCFEARRGITQAQLST